MFSFIALRFNNYVAEKMETVSSPTTYKTLDTNDITDDVRKKAEAELNEIENEVADAVNTLKDLLKREQDLFPCTDDGFLLMFLRARKFNCEAALTLIKKYYSAHVNYPSMFLNFSPKACMNVMNSNLHYFLPYRSPDGCAILLSKFGQWDPAHLSCEELLKFNLICNEMANQNPLTQICGIITIADMKGFSWSHLFQIPFSDVRCFVNTLQDCLPLRSKGVHIIHNSNIFSILYALVKPLLNEKLKQRIFFHGDNLNSLHNHLPPEILPKELGGKLTPAPYENFYNSLLNSDEIFISRRNYGYQSKRPSIP